MPSIPAAFFARKVTGHAAIVAQGPNVKVGPNSRGTQQASHGNNALISCPLADRSSGLWWCRGHSGLTRAGYRPGRRPAGLTFGASSRSRAAPRPLHAKTQSAAPDALSFPAQRFRANSAGPARRGMVPPCRANQGGCAWTKEKALPKQGQCYPHHKDILGAVSPQGRNGGCEILVSGITHGGTTPAAGPCFHQNRASCSGCGRIEARPRGSMIQPSPSRWMLASHPCCSMNTRSASAPRSA